MDAKELRIGNLVYQIQGEYNDIVDDFDFNDSNKLEVEVNTDILILIKNICHYYVFEPILLTEEWLSKFGYKKDRSGYRLIDKYNLSISCDKDNKLHACYGDRILSNAITIDYVHQLQNLYFVLNGEELILNE